MNVTYPEIGSVERVTVTKSVPFGALVERVDGMAGLVAGVTAEPGDTLNVTITEIDRDKRRFSGTAA
jgi:ribosomal protein S1